MPTLALTSTASLTVGTSGGAGAMGQVIFLNTTNANTQTIVGSAAGSSQIYTLPLIGGTFAMTGSTVGGVSGEKIMRGQVKIFGFDYPVRTTTTGGDNKIVSRVVENNPFPEVAVLAGTTRRYGFIITYGSSSAAVTSTWSLCPVSVADAACDSDAARIEFIVPVSTIADIDKTDIYYTIDDYATFTTASLAAAGPWRLTARNTAANTLQIYNIEFVAYDIVN